MKDLGFNEFGELANGGGNDEEANASLNQTEMTNVSHDPTGEEEADDTNIAI